MVFHTALLLSFALADPAYTPAQKAYEALRQRDYAQAVQGFEQAIAAAPDRAALHKDLAYTLLKIGENVAARDQFGAAMRLDPNDEHVALEYAFLCYETKQQAIARRIFDRIRKSGNPTAEAAFQNIDKPLAEGIARWSKAVELTPDNFSAHQELASLAEQRDELKLAAEHYEKAWRLKPGEVSLLLDLGRVWKQLGRAEDAMSALLAASRGGQPRVAEQARELLPSRYPYLYEFQGALALDPKNVGLRKEYAYLLLEMQHNDDAEEQFRQLHEIMPNDLLIAAQLGFLRWKRHDVAGAQVLFDQVLNGDDDELADRVRQTLNLPQQLRKRGEAPVVKISEEAKSMGQKSMKAGFLNDALKYFTIAHEADPIDFSTMLNLGWVNNILHDDREALEWFKLARKSDDPQISTEATRAVNNLSPEFQRFRTTVWIYPFFSTRWHDAFGYAQAKLEWNLNGLPVHPYVSIRFIGDARQTTTLGSLPPQYLSESSFIAGLGVSTKPWHGVVGWAEAGEAIKYLADRKDVGAMIPDYRGGISYAKGFGHLLNGTHGFFAETNEDGVFVSRFQNDMILYVQNRAGYTFSRLEGWGGLQSQVLWNGNATADRSSQYWANFVETGPGLRFRFSAFPKMLFSINGMRGVYTINENNPRRPNFFDLRAGVWYAFTR